MIALSASLNQAAQKSIPVNEQLPTTNELLINYYRDSSGANDFLSLEQWRERGFKVKKGAKCFRVWGIPLLLVRKDSGSAGSYRYWRVCCLFNESQVEPFVVQNIEVSKSTFS